MEKKGRSLFDCYVYWPLHLYDQTGLPPAGFRPWVEGHTIVDFLLWAAGGAVCRSDMVFDGAFYGRAFCISVVSDLGAETALGPLL